MPNRFADQRSEAAKMVGAPADAKWSLIRRLYWAQHYALPPMVNYEEIFYVAWCRHLCRPIGTPIETLATLSHVREIPLFSEADPCTKIMDNAIWGLGLDPDRIMGDNSFDKESQRIKELYKKWSKPLLVQQWAA